MSTSTLEVGHFAETVTVAGASPAAQHERRHARRASFRRSQVANLPLAIRNWDDLLALVPGVQGDRYTEQGGGTSFGRTGGINVHGARALQNNFLLDGVDNNSISENVQELTTQVSRPSVDAIQEFKVVTSPYSAEYGRSPGAAVSVSTKSGTNGFHGTRLRVLPQRVVRLHRLLLQACGRRKAGERSEPVRRQPRRADHQEQRVLLRRLRGHADHARRHPPHERADGRRARRHLHLAGQGSGDRAALRQQPDSGRPHRSVRGRRSSALVPLPNQPGANNFFRTADLLDNSDRLLGRIDWQPERQGQHLRPLHLLEPHARRSPARSAASIDGTGTSAFGNQTIKTNAMVGGWTRVLSARRWSTSSASRGRSRRRTPCTRRSG